MRTNRTVAAIGTATLALGASTALALPANAADGDAMLSVLHGVPDLTVDVYVNGDLTLDDFEPGDLAGPLELAPAPTPWRSRPRTPRTTATRPSGPSTCRSRPT